MQPLLEVLGDGQDYLMRAPAKLALMIGQPGGNALPRSRRGDSLVPFVGDSPYPLQILGRSLDAAAAPFHVLVGRPCKELEHPQRVGPVNVYHLVWIDDVLL